MSHDPEVIHVTGLNGHGAEEYSISAELLDAAVQEIQALVEQRDRARRLAAHLEEVCAMRTAVLRALVEWHDAPAPPNTIANRLAPIGPKAVVDWARAQLSEIP